MYIVSSYLMAVALCVVTMFCWGSWANTQKLAQKSWRFELFYWDYVLGIVLMSLIFALSLGSYGEHGRGFMEDLRQADWTNIGNALLGALSLMRPIYWWLQRLPLPECQWLFL